MGPGNFEAVQIGLVFGDEWSCLTSRRVLKRMNPGQTCLSCADRIGTHFIDKTILAIYSMWLLPHQIHRVLVTHKDNRVLKSTQFIVAGGKIKRGRGCAAKLFAATQLIAVVGVRS